MLAGIGFTVSLLIGELAFGTGGERDDHVKVGVLVGSVTSALLASVVLGCGTGPTAESRSARMGSVGTWPTTPPT